MHEKLLKDEPWYIVLTTGQKLPMFFQVIQYGDEFRWVSPAALFVEEIQWWKNSVLMYRANIRRYYLKGDSLYISSVSLVLS
jgi:hypothetical protein